MHEIIHSLTCCHYIGYRNTVASEIYLVRSSVRNVIDAIHYHFHDYSNCFKNLENALKGEGTWEKRIGKYIDLDVRTT